MNNNNNILEEEPPSYNHAIQSNTGPNNEVYRFGKFNDASFDSFERGEMFIQAFSTQIDAFPIIQAQEIGNNGFLNTIQIDTNIQNNQLFKHLKASPQNSAYVVEQQDNVRFWPGINLNHGPLEDFDAVALASHPFLKISEYNGQNKYEHQTMTHHYFEITVQQASPNVVMAIGLCTKPYPIFRMPGWNKFSVGYHSDDGHKFCDDATGGQSYGPSWSVGETVGCLYAPETGSVTFTLNGMTAGQAFSGLMRHNYFPSVGADGPAQIQVNFGRQPFKFNVDNWAGQYI
ncbi:concanavalin A-like lectin/glucanase domain-containing protein [Parasitella parasitica]|nr:concanavalin A-like lectin/glucanase domain-containing protein [Parasitella parasitica]